MVIILDGLDECDESSISTILTLIQGGLPEARNKGSKPLIQAPSAQSIKWLIVSRPDDAIYEQLNGCARIDLEANGQHVKRAVEQFVEAQVASLAKKKRYDLKLQQRVQHALQNKAEGTFLWVSLACAQLAKPGVRAMHADRMINELPSGLTPLYRTILDDILMRAQNVAEEDRESIISILRSMSVAFRPLTIFELGMAADLPDEYRTNRSALEDFVRICGGLVLLRHDTVHFVHSSARTFLVTTKEVVSQNAEEDHLWMASNCLYSLNTAFDESMDMNGNSGAPGSSFLDYPAMFWNKHARNASIDFFQKIYRGDTWIAQQSYLREAWFSYHWKSTHSEWDAPPTGMSTLLVSAYAAIPALVQVIIETHGSLSVRESDSDGNSALLWAAKGNDRETARLLLSHGAIVNSTNKKEETPLHWAAFNGDHLMGNILITRGAEVDSQDAQGWTPLHRAAFGSHIRMVQALLDAGAEVDKKDQYSWTALQRSASTGDVEILRKLANHKAHIEVRDREGMSPLSTASWNGRTVAIKELLSRGAKIEAHDYEGWTALHHACWNGREDSASLLIERGANVNALNKEGASPLFQATWSGHVKIVEMLLDNGADANQACDGGETPLQQAAWTGHTDIVTLLIGRGASINVCNDDGLTALHQASVNGQDEVVELLLEVGADPNVQNSDGQTAYEQAEENSYSSTALVLLEKGSPHPSLSSSASEHEFGVIDSAIANILSIDPAQTVVQRHGHACSSRSWKVTVVAEANTRLYFLKTGPNINMFAGKSTRGFKRMSPDNDAR